MKNKYFYKNNSIKPSFSIIIINYNEKKYLEKCIKSILKNTNKINYEIIVVDNGSYDKSIEYLKQLSKINSNIKAVILEKNIGYSPATNIGYNYSNGDLIVLLSNDTIVTSGWLEQLFNVLNSDKRIGCAQSKLLLMDHPSRIDSVGHIVDHLGFLRPRGFMNLDKGQFDCNNDICVVQVVACLLRKSIIDEIGLFDDDYFIIHEDTDLSLRIHLAGYKIALASKSIVYHKRSLTLSKMAPEQLIYLTRRNSLMTILKNYEIRNIIRYLPLVISIYLGMIIWYLLQGRGTYSISMYKAILWNMANLKRIMTKRAFVQNIIRKVSDREVFKKFDKINLARLLKFRKYGPLLTIHLTL